MDHDAFYDNNWRKQIGDSLETNNFETQTVDLKKFLDGTIASYYRAPSSPHTAKPTLILINDFATTVDIFRHQLSNSELSQAMNMLAIEPLGHGRTRSLREQFTYWDSATMCLEVLDALEVTGKVFVAGLGQGGWIAVRMALLAPERIAGIVPMSTMMESSHEERPDSKLGPYIEKWEKPYVHRMFEPDVEFVDARVSSGLGWETSQADKDFWTLTMRKNWSGEEGRKRARISALNLRDRESLRDRLKEIERPVLWLHGSKDRIYDVELARKELQMFENSPSKRLEILEASPHWITWSNGAEVNKYLLEFVQSN